MCFFKSTPDSVVAGALNDMPFDDFILEQARVHLACPSGAGPHASVINFASATPSKIRGRAEFGLYLRVSTASNPSSTNCRRVRRILAMLVSTASAIRLSLQPSPASDTSAFNRMRAFVNNGAERLPLRIRSLSCARSDYAALSSKHPGTQKLLAKPRR